MSFQDTFKVAIWLGAAGVTLTGRMALAEEALPVQAAIAASAAETSVVGNSIGLTPQPATAKVYLEQPVGSVIIGEASEDTGRARYAVRSGGADSGDVRFSALRPRTGSRDEAAGNLAVSAIRGSVPAGLPVGGRLTSQFGGRVNPVSGVYQHHAGIDLAAATGSPVATTGDGVVRFAGFAGNYGLLVVVDHGRGIESRYAHLSRLAVSRGQGVTRGQAVGLVGSTGRSTGPHLHYEVRTNGRALNPLGN